MRKLKTIIFILLSVFITLGCASQNKTNSKKTLTYNFNLTKDFETFDSVRFNTLRGDKKHSAREFLTDGTEIALGSTKLQKSYIAPRFLF